ncbi:MAG: cation transporter [Bacteriovorax sp.]|nr:cation transporter [Bacteriovorax sp.]
MSDHCCGNGLDVKINEVNKNFKRALWIALVLNFSMFFLENIQGVLSQSLSLRADAIDFLGDSVNYFITLFVLSSAIRSRAKVSLLKAFFMLGFGIWVLGDAIIRFYSDSVPNYFTMTWVGSLALIINGFVAFLLFKFKEGDSNMQSVWLCSRNDAIGNLAVIIASSGVYYFSSKWPDLIVAILMAYLSVSASYKILLVVKKEFKESEEKCVI